VSIRSARPCTGATKTGKASEYTNHHCAHFFLLFTLVHAQCADAKCRWYNVPPVKPSKKDKGKSKSSQVANETGAPSAPAQRHARTSQTTDAPSGADENSKTLDFSTFVPRHDASLHFAVPPQPPPLPEHAYGRAAGLSMNSTAQLIESASINPSAAVGADEAFSRAMGAMYWCGYWTAVYHSQRRVGSVLSNDEAEEEGAEHEEHKETQELLSTQRS